MIGLQFKILDWKLNENEYREINQHLASIKSDTKLTLQMSLSDLASIPLKRYEFDVTGDKHVQNGQNKGGRFHYSIF